MDGTKFIDSFKDNIFDDMFVFLPSKIVKIVDEKRITIKPLFKREINGEIVEFPIIVNVPLMNLGNDNAIIEIEPKVGDIVAAFISDYDAENLILTGKNEPVNTETKHQLNDAFAFPFSFTPFNGTKSHANKIKIDALGNVSIESENDINLTTQGTGDVNIDCFTYNVNQRGV